MESSLRVRPDTYRALVEHRARVASTRDPELCAVAAMMGRAVLPMLAGAHREEKAFAFGCAMVGFIVTGCTPREAAREALSLWGGDVDLERASDLAAEAFWAAKTLSKGGAV